MRIFEMRGLLCFGWLSIAAASLFLSSLAPAAEGDDDVVMLSNGGRLRGAVIEEDPQSGVRIKLLDGTIRTLRPAEVREIRYHGETGSAAPATATPAAGASAAPAPINAPSDAQPTTAAVALAPSASWQEDTTTAASPQAKPDSGHRFELGIRLGYAMPMGHLTGSGITNDGTMTNSIAMSDVISSKLPILFEAGYAVSPNVVLGVHFQYAVINDKTDQNGCPSGFDCSDHDIEIGVQGQYHFSPSQTVDPWLGIGFGYEFENFSGSGQVNGGTLSDSFSGGFKGPQYLKLQGGLDCLAAKVFVVGPFLSFSVAQYSSSTSSFTSGGMSSPSTTQDIPFTALHEWLTVGVKGTFRIGTE